MTKEMCHEYKLIWIDYIDINCQLSDGKCYASNILSILEDLAPAKIHVQLHNTRNTKIVTVPGSFAITEYKFD